MLQHMVASLVERVTAGEQLLQEANRRLAEQEAHAKLLANQVADLQPVALPVVMRTDSADTPAAATVHQDDEAPSVTTAPQEGEEQVAQDDSPVGAAAMEEDESPANGDSQGEAAPPDTGGVEESASIASTVHG